MESPIGLLEASRCITAKDPVSKGTLLKRRVALFFERDLHDVFYRRQETLALHSQPLVRHLFHL
jgi:hypothetical protein